MTRLRDKIQVAPLDAARLARIEGRVVAAHERDSARPAARRAPWRLVTAGAIVACVALLAAGYVGWRAASPGAAPPSPSLTTAPGERARLDVDGAAVAVGESSRVLLRSGPDGAVIVDLTHGRVDCEVAPRRARAPFTVQAGDVAVEVVGTSFSVERTDTVLVRVIHGVVRVTAAGRRTMQLSAGDTWTSRPPELAASPPRTRSPSPSRSAPPAPIPIPPRIPIPTPTPSASPTRSPAPARSRQDLHPPPGLPRLSCHAIDPCRDIALETTGPDAGQALYSLIHLQLFRERDAAQAVTLAELYERRFARRRPREAEAVLWLRVLAHREAGENERSRAAAQTYLDRHPRGAFADPARRIVRDATSSE